MIWCLHYLCTDNAYLVLKGRLQASGVGVVSSRQCLLPSESYLIYMDKAILNSAQAALEPVPWTDHNYAIASTKR